MNFFMQQHQARQRTTLLVIYFALAIMLIIAAVNAACYRIYFIFTNTSLQREQWFTQPYWVWITLATVAVILFGTVRELIRLGGGGVAMAEMVGARRIRSNTTDPDEKRLMNVMEEMSIASGTPRPALFVMENEPAINAFVAGYRPTEAVLVVTRGTLQTLNRDELQGVIGHEYSHILNGDMRLNIRLWGIVSGILLIGQTGHAMFRYLRESRDLNIVRRLLVGLVGLTLIPIGYIGLFFGRLIKAAISRQREFLADASSVQFTRNPDDIAGALWKIKQHTEGSLLRNAHAEDLSHMCFGPSLNFSFDTLLATHPPLDERIRAVDPGFIPRQKIKAAASAQAETAAAARGFARASQSAIAATSGLIAASIGNLTSSHMDYAAALHASLPPALLESLREEEGATCAVFGMLLAGTYAEQRDAVCAIIRTYAGESAVDLARHQALEIGRLGARLPIINLVIPTLKMLNPEARRKFLDTVEACIHADHRFTMFEFTLLTLLQDHLSASAHTADQAKYFKYENVLDELQILFTVLARAGATSLEQFRQTFSNIMGTFNRTLSEPAPAQVCTAQRLGLVLRKLGALTPLLKQSVITACAD